MGSTRNPAASDCACEVAADQSVKKPWGIAFGDVLEGVGQEASADTGVPVKNSWKVPGPPNPVPPGKGPVPAVESRMKFQGLGTT